MTLGTNRLSTNSLPAVSYLLQYDCGELDQVENHVHWPYCPETQFRGTHRRDYFPRT